MEQNITIKKGHLFGRSNFIGGFIAAHGAVHAMLLNTPRPDGGAGNFVTRGGDVPMLGSLGLGSGAVEIIGAALMLITTAAFLISAFMYLRDRRGWENWLITSSALSMVSVFLFWNDWMVMAPIIGVGLAALALRSRLSEVAA